MASIVGFNVTINSACDINKNKSCHLAYTYNVLWDENDPQTDEEFKITAELWAGGTLSRGHLFADSTNDAHNITRATSMPVIRKVGITCDQLDMFWGENIGLKLVMVPASGGNIRYEALSSTEMEEQIATPAMELEKEAAVKAA